MTILDKTISLTFLLALSINLLAQNFPINSTCNEAELIEIKNINFSPSAHNLNIDPVCSNGMAEADVFYKFIVPSTGAIKLSRSIYDAYYGYTDSISFVYGGLALYNNCNETPIYCKPIEHLDYYSFFDSNFWDNDKTYGSVVIADLTPNDTLILQLFSEYLKYDITSYETTFEVVEPTKNNSCNEAISVNMYDGFGCVDLISFSLLENSLDILPACYEKFDWADENLLPFADIYYKALVPESGTIEFNLSSAIGVAIYDACGSNSIFCVYETSYQVDGTANQFQISNLTAGANIIIQFFDYFDLPDNFSFCLKDSNVNSACENAKWIEIKSEETHLLSENYEDVETYLSCSGNYSYENGAISYYKFIVPASGGIRFNNYGFGLVEYSIRIFDNCNEEELFCDIVSVRDPGIFQPELRTYITVEELPPGDTLIVQLIENVNDLYYPMFSTVVDELPPPPEPAINNNCENANWIDLKPNFELTFVPVNHSGNTIQTNPGCYSFNDLFADSYYQLVVPPSGRISFNHYYNYGISIYDFCNEENLFCAYRRFDRGGEILAEDLNPGDTIIIQAFQRSPEYIDASTDPFYPKYELEPVIFNLSIKEVPKIPINNICSKAELIDMTEIVFNPEMYELETKPYCDTDPYYANYRADAFYKFIVPSSGAVKFGRKPESYYYHSLTDINDVYFGDNICGFSIYETCNSEPLFCFPDEDYNTNNDSRNREVDYGTVVIDQLNPNDTLILHLYAPGFDQDYTINLSEANPLPNNTCEEAVEIDINNDTGSSELISVSLSQNTLDKIPSCHTDPEYGQFHPYSDVFYQLAVPDSGGFELELSSEIGIAVYDACNGNELFCKYPITTKQGIYNLTPNSNVIIQFYDYFDWQEGFSFSINADAGNKGCNQSDWIALKSLYESTNGDNWINNTGWEQVKRESMPVDCDLSLLFGVNLNTNGRVYCLDLDGINDCTYVAGSKGNNLAGTLTYEMHLLSDLTILCLNNNEISGNISSWLGKNLEQLFLHNNKLTGEIPYTFFEELNKLEKIYLSSNNLSGRIPHTIKHCRNLTHLGLYENQFEDDIPNLSELKKLQVLNLRNNQLTGNFPSELSEIPTLKGLYLSNNQLSGYFNEDLTVLCNRLAYPNASIYIDTGNGFEAKWDDFCSCGAGSGNPLYLFYDSPIQTVYQHNADIVAFDFIVGLNNQQSITFSAVGITLEEGFEVKKGSSFLAEYNPCGE